MTFKKGGTQMKQINIYKLHTISTDKDKEGCEGTQKDDKVHFKSKFQAGHGSKYWNQFLIALYDDDIWGSLLQNDWAK